MINIFVTIATLLLVTAGQCRAETVIQAEIPTSVTLSNTDINRIVCPGEINDLIFSQEKGITGHFAGNNGFVKFKIEKAGERYTYADSQSELFVVCNNAVYTLLATPKDIPSVTLRLASPRGDSFKENIAHHKNLPLEKQTLQLIREAYNDVYPTSYKITQTGKTIPLTAALEVHLYRVVDVDGVGLRLKQYTVKSLAQDETVLNEQMFLASSISSSMLAIALEQHTLTEDQTTRLFVVEQKEPVQ